MMEGTLPATAAESTRESTRHVTCLRTLQRKLERMELEHLRQHALELHGRLERAEAELERATEIADFWQRHAHDLQLSLLDEDFATHRRIGINKGGELMVVKAD